MTHRLTVMDSKKTKLRQRGRERESERGTKTARDRESQAG